MLLINVRCVGESLVLQLLARPVREPALETSPTGANTAEKPSEIIEVFKDRKELTLKRNAMNVSYVGRPSDIAAP